MLLQEYFMMIRYQYWNRWPFVIRRNCDECWGAIHCLSARGRLKFTAVFKYNDVAIVIISASMYELSIDPLGIQNDATQEHRPDVFVCPCVNVHHMLPPGWFKFQINVKKRSESIDANRYASISHRTRGKPSGCQYREQYAITCTVKLAFLCELLDHTVFRVIHFLSIYDLVERKKMKNIHIFMYIHEKNNFTKIF